MIYISGAITGDTHEQWVENYQKGREVAIQMAFAKIPYHSPHLNTWKFEDEPGLEDMSWQDWIDMDLEVLGRCSGILMMQGWESSKGAVVEREFAILNHIRVYYDIEQIQKFPPEQAKKKTLEQNAIAKIIAMGVSSLSPDKFEMLQTVVAQLRETRHLQ